MKDEARMPGGAMGDGLEFDDAFLPVPPGATDADPAAAIRGLLYRVARLEQTLAETRQQAVSETSELLLEMVSISDDIAEAVERWGVASNAREAALVRALVGLGRKIAANLSRHQVEPIQTVGAPVNPDTSEVARTASADQAPPGVVLREERTGYAWPHGLLRRARVVVSARADA